MQPYIFPYIGYMNLVCASDAFVFYDDVNYIKQGWINRNQILVNGQTVRFTMPLSGASSFKPINEIHTTDLDRFSSGFLRQLELAYRGSPYVSPTLNYIEDVLCTKTSKISELAAASIEKFFAYVGVNKHFMKSSEAFPHTFGAGRLERLVAIVQELGGNHYMNSIGGAQLYSKSEFQNYGIVLSLVKPSFLPYPQRNSGCFIPGLSVLDLMMNLSICELKAHLRSYKLV